MEDEKQAARKRRDKRYNDYVKQVTPKHNCLLNMLKAFVSGGFICVIGQMFSDWYGSMGLMKDEVSGYTTLSLILISVILTCLNWVGPITKFAGAGYLVPITGFANSVAACALEFKAEGEVFGVGCKIFTIAAHFPDIILSKHLHHPINCSQYPAGDNAVQDHRACNQVCR